MYLGKRFKNNFPTWYWGKYFNISSITACELSFRTSPMYMYIRCSNVVFSYYCNSAVWLREKVLRKSEVGNWFVLIGSYGQLFYVKKKLHRKCLYIIRLLFNSPFYNRVCCNIFKILLMFFRYLFTIFNLHIIINVLVNNPLDWSISPSFSTTMYTTVSAKANCNF